MRPQAELTVEILHPDGRKDQIARDVPLQSMTFDKTDSCSDRISVNVGLPGHKPVTHVIVEPIHIRLKSAENGSFNPMQIDAESGTTLVTFRPALRADFLQGLRA